MQTASKQNYGTEQFTKAWTVAREASIHPSHAFAWRTVPHSMEKTACVQGPVLLADHINHSQDFTHINKSYLSFLAKNHNIFEPSLLLIKNFHGLIFSWNYLLLSLPVLHSAENRSRISLAPKCNHRWNCQTSVEISPISPRIQQRHPGLSSHSTRHPLLVILKRHPIFWDRLIQKEVSCLIATWLFCEWCLLMEMRLFSYELRIWLELINHPITYTTCYFALY